MTSCERKPDRPASIRRFLKNPTMVFVHPPAISKRYLKTKFMPYGMAALYAFLKQREVPVVQYDFLMEYLFSAPKDVDYHNPDKSFSEKDFFAFLHGKGSHHGLSEFARKYGSRLGADAGIYAFSIVSYHQFWASLLLARHIREVNPNAVIVFGGPYITIKPADSFVKHGMADFWIKGSGEIPLLMLYRFLAGDKGISLADIPGIIYADGPQCIQTPQSRMAAENEHPPDFEGLCLDDYRYDHPLTGEQTFFLPYRISKGCPSNCSFCTGRLVDAYNCKSVEKVISEVKEMARQYGTRAFQFADASINGHPRRLAAICDGLAAEFPEIRWYSYAKVRGFTPELLAKVKKAGCFSLFWGVESAHQPTVDLLGKRFNVERMYHLIDEAIRVGIKNYVHLIYHTPHESAETVEHLIRLVNRYIDSDMVVFLPQRFLLEAQSPMFERPARYGLANVRRVETSIFEREQFIYHEIGWGDYSKIVKRNEIHKEILAEHLARIRYRGITNGSKSRIARRVPARLLVRTGKYSERSELMRCIHSRLLRWIESGNQEISEQL